ncbi:MAG TPA: hypothetical protein VFB62_20225 [Polyangiaceae bacterium]|nr:hypothetical protein [Polyangiaceae bacterium]
MGRAIGALCLGVVACASETDEALPCDVATVMRASCEPCHSSPPVHGALMPLVTFEDTRAPFTALPTYDATPVWQVIGDVVQSGWMPQPLEGVSLSTGGRDTLLDWVGRGAPSGEACP